MFSSQDKIHKTDLCLHNTKINVKYKGKTILEIDL